ncbi:MAG: hypothetical protein FJ279_07290 [Planctomycetes bacterium]|nr:hypothetical protein [Planctomycetota bacterium]
MTHVSSRNWVAFALAMGMSLGGVGCASLGVGNESAKKEAFLLTLSLDGASFRPGDAVICTARLQNLTDDSIVVTHLNAASIGFWLNEVGTDTMFRSEPISSPLEPMGETRAVEAGKSLERKFLFPRATVATGRFAVIAKYEPSPREARKRRDPVYGRSPGFVVEGEAMLRRDPAGVLMKEDAIRLAKERVGVEVKDAQAILARNEAGFLDWWVNLEIAPSAHRAGEPSVRSYLVNPYIGSVRKEAKPFDEKTMSDVANGKSVAPVP